MACVEENDEGPKQKYLRFLIVKGWNKKEKIPKFYQNAMKVTKNNMENTIMILKMLIVLHNYFKKGPPEVITVSSKEYSPLEILKKIETHWKAVAEKCRNPSFSSKPEPKDKARSLYFS